MNKLIEFPHNGRIETEMSIFDSTFLKVTV